MWKLLNTIAFFLLALPALASAEEPLSVTLAPATGAPAGAAIVVLTLTNNGDTTLTLHTFFLPFSNNGDSLPTDQFRIIALSQNAAVTYKGHFGSPDLTMATGFIPLGPHASISGTIDLSPSYNFQNFGFGKYSVTYTQLLGILPAAQQLDIDDPLYSTNPNRSREVVSNTITVNFNHTASVHTSTTGEQRSSAD